jgi:PKD repeat protein
VQTDVQTVTDYITMYQTEVRTDVSVQTQTQLQTVVQSVTVLKTLVSTAQVTTTNSDGKTIVQTNVETLTFATVSVSTTGIPAPAQTNPSVTGAQKSSTPIGPIVGGAIGGAALLGLAAIFLFAAARRGWFDKKHPDGVAGVAAAVSGGRPPMAPAHKVDNTPQPIYTPQPTYVQPATYDQRRTMSPVPAYEVEGRGPQYAEMSGRPN